MKKITCFFLVLLALVFIFPVLFLVVGSLMGKNELTDLLFPVLQEGAKGYASWKLFPEYPTLKHYVEVLLDSPEFFVMFWKIKFGKSPCSRHSNQKPASEGTSRNLHRVPEHYEKFR